jgi:hypothetical protein
MESNRFLNFMKGMIKMSLKTLLSIATEDGFNELDEMEVGSEQYISTAKVLNDMSDRIIKIEEHETEVENQKIDEKLRLKQMRQEQIDRYVKHGLTAVSVLGGLIITVWGAKASWRFEETGTVTSTAGRKFINNLFFRK